MLVTCHTRSLRRCSRHYQTGEALPEAVVEMLAQSSHLGGKKMEDAGVICGEYGGFISENVFQKQSLEDLYVVNMVGLSIILQQSNIAVENPLLVDRFHWENQSFLIGGLEHGFYDFPFSWECHHPN